MRLDARKEFIGNYIVRDLSTGEDLQHICYADDETGEYGQWEMTATGPDLVGKKGKIMLLLVPDAPVTPGIHLDRDPNKVTEHFEGVVRYTWGYGFDIHSIGSNPLQDVLERFRDKQVEVTMTVKVIDA